MKNQQNYCRNMSPNSTPLHNGVESKYGQSFIAFVRSLPRASLLPCFLSDPFLSTRQARLPFTGIQHFFGSYKFPSDKGGGPLPCIKVFALRGGCTTFCTAH
jgi:hypothetical protein